MIGSKLSFFIINGHSHIKISHLTKNISTLNKLYEKNLLVSDINTVRLFSNSQNVRTGFFGRVKNTMADHSRKKQANEYEKQILMMANNEKWDLKSYSEIIDSSLSGWRHMFVGIVNTQVIQNIKKNQSMINAAKEILGENANVDDINIIGKKVKVRQKWWYFMTCDLSISYCLKPLFIISCTNSI